jgi:hypothetical protein
VGRDRRHAIPSRRSDRSNLAESAQWSNADPFPHNVTSESGSFHSEDLAPDGTWVFRPTECGTFEYHCTLHPGMKAVAARALSRFLFSRSPNKCDVQQLSSS